MNYITEYVNKIRDGEIIVSARVRKIYEKLQRDIEDPQGKYIFDEKKALKPIIFIQNFCAHSKGEFAGKKLELQLFQKAYLSALFGFVDKETGYRRYKETLFYVARKNGKSTLLAGIALYCLIADNEPGAEVYSVATKKDQAKIVFDEVCNMVKQSPELAKHCKKRKSDLYFTRSMSKMQPLGRDHNTMDGLNASLAIIDELHAIKSRETYEVLKQSQSARRQPLLIMITTAGTVREAVGDDIYKYACDVCDGIIADDRFLPIIYELDNKQEYLDPNAWSKANPGLGTIKKLEDLIEKVKRAKQSPKDLTGMLTKDFNIKQNSTTAWLQFDDIENTETFNIEDFKGLYGIGGADLSLTGDLTCATVLLMDENEKRYVLQMYFLPKENFWQRVQEEKIPYDKWYEQGLLRLCEGNKIDYKDVTAWFREIVNDYEITIPWIYYDRYSAVYWVQEMKSYGFNMVDCAQGARTLSVPMQSLEQDLKAKKINYNNNPLLKWCLSNTALELDRNGNYMPKKNSSPKYRIDGTASLLDAYAGLDQHYREYLNIIQYIRKRG